MKSKPIKTKLLVFATIMIVFAALWQTLLTRCPERPKQLHINSTINIQDLYPWPGAKIPFACHIRDFLKSPFAPDIYNSEDVFKEDGYRVLRRQHRRYREGVIVVRINDTGEIHRQFPERPSIGHMHPLAEALSLYTDGKRLEIGHAGYIESYFAFNFATILTPFLWPGDHVGKIVILLPSGEAMEYEWHFEITWW